jgi:DNA-binding response OmpR family regulator
MDASLEPARMDMDVHPTDATEGAILVSEPSVLIVDRSEENREVLKAALERRGWKTFSANRAKQGLELARQHRPDVIVLDLELSDSSPEELCAPFARESEANCTNLVVLGSLRRSRRAHFRGEFVAKPYHYGPLVRRIEQLLDSAGRHYARCA